MFVFLGGGGGGGGAGLAEVIVSLRWALELVINSHILVYSAMSSLYLSPHKVNYRVLELSSDLTTVVKLLVPQHDVPRTGTDEITHPLSRLFSAVNKNTSCVVC